MNNCFPKNEKKIDEKEEIDMKIDRADAIKQKTAHPTPDYHDMIVGMCGLRKLIVERYYLRMILLKIQFKKMTRRQ